MEKISIPRELDIQINKQIADLVNKVTCQLFLKDGKYDFSPLGTGVLVKLGGIHYIFTAAHVAEEFDKKLFLMTPTGKFIELFGECQMSNYNKKPKFDVAYFKLSKGFGEILERNFTFLKKENIETSHELLDAANYAIFGYPASNVKEVEENVVSTKASLFIVKPLEDKAYDYYKFEKHLFYILEFKGRGISLETGEKSNKLGKQNGLSGCGLWFMEVTKLDGQEYEVVFSLIGIMTDERYGKYKSLIANKINVLISGIASMDNNEEAKILLANSSEVYIHERKSEG